MIGCLCRIVIMVAHVLKGQLPDGLAFVAFDER
jgi:hypothetical protein